MRRIKGLERFDQTASVYLWSRYILSFSLLPIVIPVGIRLRSTLLRLPEAPGQRQGTAGELPTKHVLLALGESPIAGVGLADQSQNLTPRLATLLYQKTKQAIEWHILGRSGLRLEQCLPRFGSQLPPKVDILFIDIGANDCKDGTPLSHWIDGWQKLLYHLRSRYPKALIICSSIPPFRSFPALPWAVRAFLGYRSDLMNALLKKELQSWERCIYIPLPPILSKEYFAEDGFHPNPRAHYEWAQGLFDEIHEQL